MYVKHKKVRYSKCWKKDCHSLLLKIIRLVSLHWRELSWSDSLSKAVMFSLHWKSGPSPAGILRRFFLGASEKKKKRIIFLHVCTRYRYMFDIFLKQISWPRLPSPPFSSLSQLIGIHRRCNGIFARRSIALDALTHATCNNFPHYNWKNPPKKTSNFAVSKSLLLQSIHDVFVDVLSKGRKLEVALRSSSWWCSDHFYIKLHVLRSKLYQKYLKYIYHIQCAYLYHICYFYFFLSKNSESHLPLPSPIHIPFQQSAPAFAASQKR